MASETGQQQLIDMLTRQAIILFGQERTEKLRPQIEERAKQLWLIDQHLPGPEEEPDFVFLMN